MARNAPAAKSQLRFHKRDHVAIAMDCVNYAMTQKPWSHGDRPGRPRREIKAVRSRTSIATARYPPCSHTKPFVIDGDTVDQPLAESFKILIDLLGQKFGPSAHQAIPYSCTSHDQRMLEWGRSGVPLCAEGSQCKATALRGHHGPLGIYLTVAQDRALQNGEKVTFPEDALCLLCYRANARHMQMACEASGRAMDATMVPPFQNYFNCPGGYKEAFMGACIPVDGGGMIRIAAMTRDLQVRVQPTSTGNFYIDQSAIEYSESPGDAPRSVTPPAPATLSPQSPR